MSDKEEVMGQGRSLFKQGEKGGDLYFIKSGEVELQVKSEDSGKEAIVATLGSQSIIGTMSFLEGDKRSATAVTKTEVKFIRIKQQQKEALLSQVPKWLRLLVKDLTISIRKINENYVKTLDELNVLKKKLDVKEKQKKEIEGKIEKNESEASDQLKASKETQVKLEKRIKELEKEIAESKKN